jgi:hypothetical protein
VSAYGKLWVGDSVDGRIGTFDKDTYDEYGEVIFRRKSSQPFTVGQTPLFVSELRATMESGTGTTTVDPQLVMRFSDNGGRTWSNGFFRSYGLQGEYQEYPIWRRLGRIPRNRVFEFTTSAKVKSNLLRLDAE